MVLIPPLSHISWEPCWRIVSSSFPPRGLFDRVSSQEDLELVLKIEGLTNDRLRNEIGELALVPEEESIYGEGTNSIMAAFTHLNPIGSRFADGSYGVYYAAESIDTAIAETRFHKERFLRATREDPIDVDMRSYASNINGDVHDIRGQQEIRREVYDPNPEHYGTAQALAKSLRSNDSNGIVYDSVRDQGGECVAVFRPNLLSPAIQGEHFCYVWNGTEISNIYVKTEYQRRDRK